MTELTSEVIAFDYDGDGNLTNPEYYSTLLEDFPVENKGSAIKISNDKVEVARWSGDVEVARWSGVGGGR